MQQDFKSSTLTDRIDLTPETLTDAFLPEPYRVSRVVTAPSREQSCNQSKA